MQSIEQLNKRFAIEGVARFEMGSGGLPRLNISAPAADGHVYLHGAHVTHYQPRGQAPVLFLSSRSAFEAGKPIRGGVPIIFPWFGPREGDATQPMHGLVRTRSWEVAEVSDLGEAVRATFTLAPDDAMRTAWPEEFELRFVATFGGSLDMELHVENKSGRSFKYEEALHTYFAVNDVRSISVQGLGGADYVDKLLGFERRKQEEEALKLTGQTDRVYLDTQSTCLIDDVVGRRRIAIAKEHSNSTVVWNPWSDRIPSMADLDPETWPAFLCVETCNVRDCAVNLPAGETHILRATITSQPV